MSERFPLKLNETPLVAESLCAQDITAVQADIDRYFAKDGVSDISLSRANSLLRSRPLATALAVYDSQFFDNDEPGTWSAINRACKTKFIAQNSLYMISKPQTEALNEHPVVRTFADMEVRTMLDLSVPLLRRVCDSAGVSPVVPAQISLGGNADRYNKDQILALRNAIPILYPPTGYISLEKMQTAFKISSEAMSDIRKDLELDETEWYRDPVSAEGKQYVAPEEAASIVRYIRQHRSRAA